MRMRTLVRKRIILKKKFEEGGLEMEEKHRKIVKKQIVKEQTKTKTKQLLTTSGIVMIALLVVVIIFNQFQISKISGMMTTSSQNSPGFDGATLRSIDLSAIRSTGQTVAAVFPVENIVTPDDAMAMMFPTGTPDYGADLGVSFDDPVGSLAVLSKMYRSLKVEVEKNNPEAWARFMNMASKPVGISCEYCCGVGPIGIDSKGNSACGCQHNPALLSVALYLTSYTDFTDAQVLQETMKWKTLFFPKNMIELGMSVAGGDTSAVDNLPGMVGGC